jgi:hypothetical protein
MKSDEKSWISTTPTGDQPALDERTKILVNMVFARFKASYGHRFESTYGDSQSLDIAKREWGFCLQGYTEAQLAKALHEAKLKFAWPPSIAEFVDLLKPNPKELGLPSTREAYQEACRCRIDPREFNWSHPAVYHAARATEFWRLKTGSEQEVWPLFEKHYQAMVQRVMDGESFAIPDQLQLEDKTDLTRMQTIQQLADQYQIEPSYLYYMQKPEGSSVRALLRDQALKQLNVLQPETAFDLPR